MSKAIELREQALAKLSEARDLTDPETGQPTPENQDRYNAVMGEFAHLDEQRQAAETTDGNVSRQKEAWQYYTGKLTGQPVQFTSMPLDQSSAKSPGEQFIESAEYRELVGSGRLMQPGSKFETGAIAVAPRLGSFRAAADDIVHTESGGSAIVPNYRRPGVQELAQAPLAMRQVLPVEDMPAGDTIEYAAQVGFDNAAAAVAQSQADDGANAAAGLKPQSSIRYEERTAPARWIATWMAVTRQTLADVNVMRSLIDNQGRLMIRIEEDRQILLGSGVAPNLTGILDDGNTGLQTLDLTGEGADANLDGVRSARRLVRTGTSRLAPTFVVVHPVDSEEFDLLKDLEGRYRAGDPFAAGGPDSPPIWKLPRVESEAITEGTGLVGSRAGATIFERDPLTVEIATQHADFFVRNLVVVLFEERLALPIWFPSAFVEITFDSWDEAS